MYCTEFSSSYSLSRHNVAHCASLMVRQWCDMSTPQATHCISFERIQTPGAYDVDHCSLRTMPANILNRLSSFTPTLPCRFTLIVRNWYSSFAYNAATTTNHAEKTLQVQQANNSLRNKEKATKPWVFQNRTKRYYVHLHTYCWHWQRPPFLG